MNFLSIGSSTHNPNGQPDSAPLPSTSPHLNSAGESPPTSLLPSMNLPSMDLPSIDSNSSSDFVGLDYLAEVALGLPVAHGLVADNDEEQCSAVLNPEGEGTSESDED